MYAFNLVLGCFSDIRIGLDLRCGYQNHESLAWRFREADIAAKHCLLWYQSWVYFCSSHDQWKCNQHGNRRKVLTHGSSPYHVHRSLHNCICSAMEVNIVSPWLTSQSLLEHTKLSFSITLAIVPTIIIVTAVCIGVETKLDAKILPIYSKAGSLAEEVFSSMRTIHAFWLQPLVSKQYDELLEKATTIARAKSPNYGVLFSTEFFCIVRPR